MTFSYLLVYYKDTSFFTSPLSTCELWLAVNPADGRAWGLPTQRPALLTGPRGQHSSTNCKTEIQKTESHWRWNESWYKSAPATLLSDSCHLPHADNTSHFAAEGSRTLHGTCNPSHIHLNCRQRVICPAADEAGSSQWKQSGKDSDPFKESNEKDMRACRLREGLEQLQQL